jgi:hypothetical protein
MVPFDLAAAIIVGVGLSVDSGSGTEAVSQSGGGLFRHILWHGAVHAPIRST